MVLLAPDDSILDSLIGGVVGRLQTGVERESNRLHYPFKRLSECDGRLNAAGPGALFQRGVQGGSKRTRL